MGKSIKVDNRGNRLKETRPGANVTGIVIGPEPEDVRLEGNEFVGFTKDVDDRRAK